MSQIVYQSTLTRSNQATGLQTSRMRCGVRKWLLCIHTVSVNQRIEHLIDSSVLALLTRFQGSLAKEYANDLVASSRPSKRMIGSDEDFAAMKSRLGWKGAGNSAAEFLQYLKS